MKILFKLTGKIICQIAVLNFERKDLSLRDLDMNLWNQYFEGCTVPSHPTACPKCSEKVGRYQINLDVAMFMCSNKNCPWPFDSVQKAAEISGKSDINKLVKAMKWGGETDSDRDGLKTPYFHKKGEESTSNSSSSHSGKFSKKL